MDSNGNADVSFLQLFESLVKLCCISILVLVKILPRCAPQLMMQGPQGLSAHFEMALTERK